MRCLPADGTKAHTFSLPRRQNTPDHPHGEDCSVCDVRPAPTQGPLSLVDFFHTGGEIARLWTPGLPILTTNHVVGETWTFLRRRDGHPSAVTFLAAVESAAWLTIVHVEEATEREPRAWLTRHNERVYSFVDATSFAVMRRERLREALAFDDDFSAAGFVEVRPAI